MRAMMRRSALVLALAFVLAASPVSAMPREHFMALVMPMADLEANRRLENELSALVERNDRSGIEALGDRIRSENGQALDMLAAMARRVTAAEPSARSAEHPPRAGEGAASPTSPDEGIILSLGPCHYAGMLLRTLVIGAARGDAKPVFRQGTVMVDASRLDALFAQNMDRCEIIKHSRSPARRVGNRCLTTGHGCLDDPDFLDDGNGEPK